MRGRIAVYTAIALVVGIVLGYILGVVSTGLGLVTPSTRLLGMFVLREAENPLKILSINTSVVKINGTPTMVLRVRIFNNSSRMVDAVIGYSEFLGFSKGYSALSKERFFEGSLGPHEMRVVEIPVKLTVTNITVPYTREGKSIVVVPKMYSIYVYPRGYGFVKAFGVAVNNDAHIQFHWPVVRSIVVKGMHVLPRLNVTKVFIDLVVENRYGAPFNYAFMVTMLVDGAEIVDHNKSVFPYRNVELKAGRSRG